MLSAILLGTAIVGIIILDKYNVAKGKSDAFKAICKAAKEEGVHPLDFFTKQK